MFTQKGFGAIWGALFLGLCFVQSERFMDPGLFPKFLFWAVVMFLAALRFFNEPAPQLAGLFRSSLPLLCYGVYVLAQIPSVAVSNNPGDAWLAWAGSVHVLLFALLLAVKFSDPQRLQHGFSLMMLITLLVLVQWGLVEWVMSLDGAVLTHRGTYEVKTSFGHRNLYGQFLMLGMAIVLPLALQKGRWSAFGWVTLFLLLFMSVVLLSRSAWIVLFVNILLLATGWSMMGARARIHFSRKTWAWTAAGAVAGLVVLALTIDQWYTLWHHFETALTAGAGTTRDRLLLFTRSWQLFAGHPFTGVGLGMWKIEFLQFDQSGMQTAGAQLFHQRPHNDYAWVFSESGFAAGLAFALCHLCGLVMAVRHFLRSRGFVELSMVMAWAAFILISFTNFPKERMEFNLVFACLLAASLKLGTVPRSSGRFIPVTVVLGSLLLIGMYGFRLKNEYHFIRGHEKRIAGDWEGYKVEVQQAKGPLLLVDGVTLPLAWHEGLAWFNQGHAAEGCALMSDALRIHPYHPHVWNGLGVCASHEGNTHLALERFQKAVAHTPTYQEAWLNIAVMFYKKGDRKNAFESFMQADTNTGNKLYRELGTQLSSDSLYVLADDFPERKLMLTVRAIRNTPDWAFSVIHNAAVNRMGFRKQVLVDAIYYMLSHCENKEDCDECRAIKEKYIPAEVLNLEG